MKTHHEGSSFENVLSGIINVTINDLTHGQIEIAAPRTASGEEVAAPVATQAWPFKKRGNPVSMITGAS